ncbi:MAG: sterol desaturase family protein [Pseudomonadota bacterium]
MDVFGLAIDIEAAKALGTVYLLQFVLFTVLAFIAKREKALRWDKDMVRSARVNWSFIVINFCMAPFVFFAANWMDGLLRSSGVPIVPVEFWEFAPAIVPALVALVAADFLDYWSHRIRHTSFLWPMHAVHHSDTKMHYLTWYRAHFVELIVIQGGYILLATLMGASPAAVAAVVILRAFHQQYIHMDVDWHHGPFELFLTSPRFHRWHHANHEEAWDKNFAGIIPLWDRLFGTWYCPGKVDQPLGFPGNPGENFVALMLFPFREWGRMIGERLPRKRKAKTEQI